MDKFLNNEFYEKKKLDFLFILITTEDSSID